MLAILFKPNVGTPQHTHGGGEVGNLHVFHKHLFFSSGERKGQFNLNTGLSDSLSR